MPFTSACTKVRIIILLSINIKNKNYKVPTYHLIEIFEFKFSHLEVDGISSVTIEDPDKFTISPLETGSGTDISSMYADRDSSQQLSNLREEHLRYNMRTQTSTSSKYEALL